MTRLLDTREMHHDVGDVVSDLFAKGTVPLDVNVDLSSPLVIDAAQIGHASLLSTLCHDLELRRTARQTVEVVAFAIVSEGAAWFEYDDGTSRHSTPGGLVLVDQSTPYHYLTRGSLESTSIEMGVQDLGLPIEIVRKAVELLPRSPLYGLITNHLVGLSRDLAQIERDPAASSVIGSTTDLLRALVASAAEVDRYARPAVAEAMLPMVQAYVRQHVRDRDLTPERIARHHGISVRSLHKLCSGSDMRLMEWIYELRLDGARSELAQQHGRPRSIAAIAHRWGFADAGHFSRRFHRRYGVTPREWRAAEVGAGC